MVFVFVFVLNCSLQIDKNALKQLGDTDLKELGIPMVICKAPCILYFSPFAVVRRFLKKILTYHHHINVNCLIDFFCKLLIFQLQYTKEQQ